jgi:hypothetical protein
MVRSYTTQLSTVFQSGQPAWAQTHVIADTIYDDRKPPDNETTLGWFELAEILLDLAGPLTDAASSEVAELLEFAVCAYGASASGAPTYDEFAVAADQLGAQLEQLALSTKQAVSRMGDVVVNDYAKLSLVGQNALCNPGRAARRAVVHGGGRHAGLGRNQPQHPAACLRKVHPDGVRGLPARTQRHLRGFPPIHRSAPPPAIDCYQTVHGRPEWPQAPRLAYTALFEAVDPNGVDNWYDTFILHISDLRGLIQDGYPPVETLNDMFKPVPDTTDPTDHGLDMNLNDMVRTPTTPGFGAAWPTRGTGPAGSASAVSCSRR